MQNIEQGKGPQEYLNRVKGTLLAALTGVTLQACSRVEGADSAPLPTGPAIETKKPVQKTEGGGFTPRIIITEAAPKEPIITIGSKGPEASSVSETVPVTISIDGSEAPPTPTNSTMEITATPSPDFSSFEPERLKDVVKKIEQGPADDEIVEQGRTASIYSATMKNGMSLLLVKETVNTQWDAKQSTVVFYDSANNYLAYNTVEFGTHTKIDKDNTVNEELRFGKGKASAVIRNAYMTPDLSGVSVLLSSRQIDDSVDFLTRNGAISIYQHRTETDPITYRKTTNIGGYVENQTQFMQEWDWLLDRKGDGNYHQYSFDRSPDGTFKEGSKSAIEINPTKNLE